MLNLSRTRLNTRTTRPILVNDFNPNHCQQGRDGKILRMHIDGGNFTLDSISAEFPTPSVQSAEDCFRMEKTINHLRRSRRLQSAVSLPPTESSTRTYSSISVIGTTDIEKPPPSSYF